MYDLALGLVLEEEVQRGLLADGVMGPLGVDEDEPVGEFLVEERQVGKEQVFVEVDEGVLDGAVKALDVGVHFGRFGVGVPALDAVGLQGLGKA
jgi:hypothetical protein